MKNPDQKNTLRGYHSSVTMPCICCPCAMFRRLPIESFIKIFFCSVGVIGEVVTGVHWRTVPKHKTYTTHVMSHESGDHEHIHKRDTSNNTSSTVVTTKPEMIEEMWFLPG